MQSVHALHVSDLGRKYHIARSIARALCHCHELGIVHSDLCCCNILLTLNKDKASESSDDAWCIKVANTGVYPDSDSLDKRRVYLAPELLSKMPLESPVSPPQASTSSPPLHCIQGAGAGGVSPLIPFTKESDVYALGITLLQLFRHTLADCKDDMCAVAASQTPSVLKIPLFPKQHSESFAPLPASLLNVISSCTMRNPKDRPSAAEIRCATTSSFGHLLLFAYLFSCLIRSSKPFQSALGIGH
jgi:serine/threonine protein kinase